MTAQAYENIYRDKKIITINNVFPLSFAVKELVDIPVKPLMLFWFSQYIGKKRGLETILQAMSKFKKNEISLTLLGTVSNEMRDYFQNYISVLQLSTEQLIFLDPVDESTIPEIASRHHIGICSEVAHIQNRDLCLTNKLFMYMLSGNALLLSNTKAQQSFLNEYPDIGMLFEQESANSVAKSLQFYIDHPDVLNQHRFNALQLAKSKLNWGIESVKWLNFINQLTD
jgi:glycosyltransferase involved in cell wall biosynthesis